jgi:hypothetical protein
MMILRSSHFLIRAAFGHIPPDDKRIGLLKVEDCPNVLGSTLQMDQRHRHCDVDE